MDDRSLAAFLQQQDVDTSGLSRFCTTPAGAIYTLTPAGTDALAMWHTLRGLSQSIGYWPVMSPPLATLGYDGPAVEDLIAYLQSGAIGRVIAAAEKIDPESWLERRLAVDAEIADEDGDDLEGYRKELEGTWPIAAQPRTQFIITDTTPLELRLVPTTVPWHVPAFYRYGGASTPQPEEHVALLRYWFETCEAEMLDYRGDLIEMYVRRPPQSRDEALTLAWKHYGYCPDVVVQGAGTVATLAATLLQARAWSFWWD